MPFLSPNQQCQSTEGKISHSMDMLTPSSPGGLPTLSLTTNSSWLPWGRVAMALISPLMPVPHVLQICTKTNQLLLVTHPRPAQNLSKFFDSFAIIGSQGLKVSKCLSMPILSSHFVMPSYAANEVNTAVNEYGYILCLKNAPFWQAVVSTSTD